MTIFTAASRMRKKKFFPKLGFYLSGPACEAVVTFINHINSNSVDPTMIPLVVTSDDNNGAVMRWDGDNADSITAKILESGEICTTRFIEGSEKTVSAVEFVTILDSMHQLPFEFN